jgi:hypothetical protein
MVKEKPLSGSPLGGFSYRNFIGSCLLGDLTWSCQLVNFVVDVVRGGRHVTLVSPEIQEVQDGT